MKNKIKRVIKWVRFSFVSFGIHLNDPIVLKDVERWKGVYHLNQNDKTALAILLWEYPEFRNLIIYRHPKGLWKYWFKLWYKPMDTLYILANRIGGGLFIQHGFSTMISAESIGENCWINQQVTIGYTGGGRPPIIGNDVMITCGAKVLGSITLGDHVVVGANAVVVKDVPANTTVGGVPAHSLH